MFPQRGTTVQSQADRSTDLTTKKAADLAAATVHLFTNDFTPLPTSLVAAFTEAAYAGYAAIAVTGWGPNEDELNGQVTTVANNCMHFSGPAAGGGPTVYGYYVLSAGVGTPLIYAERFAAPFPLTDDTVVLDLVADFTL